MWVGNGHSTTIKSAGIGLTWHEFKDGSTSAKSLCSKDRWPGRGKELLTKSAPGAADLPRIKLSSPLEWMTAWLLVPSVA